MVGDGFLGSNESQTCWVTRTITRNWNLTVPNAEWVVEVLQRTIDSFEAMQISTEELKAALQKQTDAFSHVDEAIQIGLENQTRMGISVQNMETKLDGCASYPVTRSHKMLIKI